MHTDITDPIPLRFRSIFFLLIIFLLAYGNDINIDNYGDVAEFGCDLVVGDDEYDDYDDYDDETCSRDVGGDDNDVNDDEDYDDDDDHDDLVFCHG